MIVGICELELYLYHPNSLKEKRKVIRSIIDRLQHRYNISIAEVGNNDKWQIATIGFATVSNNKKMVDETMNKVIRFIDENTELEIINIHREIS
ncbi:MAG: DUF503 domain-containing protein [Tissierellia bacterium]|nr:DUF503 domain-containing protein [Tissierellia bacterium]